MHRKPRFSIIHASRNTRVRQVLEDLLATTKQTNLTGIAFVAVDDKGNRYTGAGGVLEDDDLKQGGALLYGAMSSMFSE